MSKALRILAVAIAGPMLALGGCDLGSSPLPLDAAALSKEDLEAPVRLDGPKRDASIALCVARRDSMLSDRMGGGSPFAGQSQKMKLEMKRIEGSFPDFCDCVINGAEDQTTGLAFAMALETIDRSLPIANARLPEFSALRSIATKAGVSPEDFDRAWQESRKAMQAAITSCAPRLRPSS